MNLSHPFFRNPFDKNDEHFVICDLEGVEFYRKFCGDICQLILWIYRREGHRYELRPTILLQPFEQTKMKTL